MKKFLNIAVFILIIAGTFGAIVLMNNAALQKEREELAKEYEITIFSSPTCPHCRNVKDHVAENELDKKLDLGFKDTTIPQNAVKFQEYCDKSEYAESGCGVPLMYDKSNDKILMGDADINEYLDQRIKQ